MGQQTSRPGRDAPPEQQQQPPQVRQPVERPMRRRWRPASAFYPDDHAHHHLSHQQTPSPLSRVESAQQPGSARLYPSQSAPSDFNSGRPESFISTSRPLLSARTSSRLSRARNSLTATLSRRASTRRGSTPLPTSPLQSQHDQASPTSPRAGTPALPPHQPIDAALGLDFGESAPSPTLSSSRARRPSPHPRRPSPHPARASSYRNASTTMADRISSLTPDRGFRSLVRRRRDVHQRGASHNHNEEGGGNHNNQVLARMLAVAAAATAASLMGSTSDEAVQSLRNAATSGIDGDDGTFERFLQGLRTGRLAQRLGGVQSVTNNNGMAFFRVFRFSQQAQDAARTAQLSSSLTARNLTTPLTGNELRSSESANATSQEEPTEGRMVPVLMIGIRSLPEHAPGDHTEAMPSFLDALTNFPPINMNMHDDAEPDDIVETATAQAISARRQRRASMSFFSGAREASRRRQGSPNTSRPLSEVMPSSTGSSTPLTPIPPPTTPSSRPLSTMSSRPSTPTRRTSVSSSNTTQASPGRREHFRQTARTALESTAEEETAGSQRATRARRLSESDFLRYGSGSARRNGVVEPDNSNGSRSWIIYVLGGNYPENHPILMAPSLFTDSPTYEDMMMLSSMLGPAKPPVATADDIASAGGVVRFESMGDDLIAIPDDGTDPIVLTPSERCLVCLSGYSVDETARRLIACGHLFHQECIDQWLTTGRNSCPLCRRQGVEEKTDGSSSSQVNDSASAQTESVT